MALIQCPECGQQVSDKAKTCVHCGMEIKICPECGKAIQSEVAVCSECGFTFAIKEEPSKWEQTPDLENIQNASVNAGAENEEGKTILQEFSFLSSQWERRERSVRILKGIFNFLSFLPLLSLVIAVIIINKDYINKGNITSINFWAVLLYSVRYIRIAIILLYMGKLVEKIGTTITENIILKDLQTLGREKYLHFLKSAQTGGVVLNPHLYKKVTALAMTLDVPKEKTTRIITIIWSFFVDIIECFYLIIFVWVFAAKLYQNGGDVNIFKLLFGEMLFTVLSGIVVLGGSISISVIENKREKRRGAWAKSIRENPEIK